MAEASGTSMLWPNHRRTALAASLASAVRTLSFASGLSSSNILSYGEVISFSSSTLYPMPASR